MILTIGDAWSGRIRSCSILTVVVNKRHRQLVTNADAEGLKMTSV